MSRKPIFAANWKMNKGASETEDFIQSFLNKTQGLNLAADIVIAPPFISLPRLADLLHNSNPGKNAHAVQIAAQNCSQYDSGAYTGEVSVLMLREFFVHYVILGHSERRSIFGETDAVINAKIKKAREANLKPIFCIGETLEEREGGKLESVLKTQVTEGLKDISEKDLSDIVIAYEPVWAIGTGVTATSEQAQEAHAFVRSLIAGLYGSEPAAKVRIQYGGSVKPGSAAELMACPDIDGALIGGAALEPQSFLEIIKNGTAE
ncbi:MAG: triose-phosphate isomerase [Akkermansiaceae bacterium]|jgi:triosephosphate isomerase (TIM)|nr:triose-phosphate isomerase [Akkermansiaceae bacterium]MDP4647738.1 triose-phosphate isomerase [Akkermansiaceae bacterium]MDP4722201.1 triose-phosphate isomerase [Akkermansiaceae bacterium]MDP4780242.1 triose-phosphate isomerase [Akkermansiaceae bacterium]MDP4848611.1 triose-phosphate isomerase [Akkermansiaceae bacterium]